MLFGYLKTQYPDRPSIEANLLEYDKMMTHVNSNNGMQADYVDQTTDIR